MDVATLNAEGYAALTAGGRLVEAEAYFRRSLDQAPDDPEALVGWAIVQRACDRPAKAETALRRAVSVSPDLAEPWAQLGTTMRVLNRLKMSDEFLERALRLEPDHAYARRNLEVLAALPRQEGCLVLDHPPRPRVRHGFGQPVHARLAGILAQGKEIYRQRVDNMAKISDDLAGLPSSADTERPVLPWWNNSWFPPLDAAMLCSIIADYKPAHMLEIGSGMSTRFARWSIDRFHTGTMLHSIDPEPRSEIDALCNEITRCRLEEVDSTLWKTLSAGDILFFDGSHRSFQNSDVTVFFLEILPELSPGVLVHIHDIFLPFDYPPDWLGRMYNEQYLLAAQLLAGQTRYRVIWPAAYVADLISFAGYLPVQLMTTVKDRGGSFWMEIL